MSRWRGKIGASGSAVVLASAWLVGLVPGGAEAHTLDTLGFSEIRQRGDDVHYELLVDYAAFAIVTGIGTPGATSYEDTDGDPNGNLDNYLLGMRERLDSNLPASPQPSSHIWTAPVPAGLEPGGHVVTIRSTDPFGQTTETSQQFEVLGG